MFLYTTYVCIYVCLLYAQHECTNIIIMLMYVHINIVCALIQSYKTYLYMQSEYTCLNKYYTYMYMQI